MTFPSVWIIILNWNGGPETTACLSALAESTYPAHILVMDNGSLDGSPDAIAAQFPDIEIVRLGVNTGFSYAVNRGVERALADGAQYVLLLNNDTHVAPDMLEHLVAYAEDDASCGLVSPLIYQVDHPERFWVVGGRWQIYDVVNEGWDTPDTGQYSTPTIFDLVFGTALLIKRTLIERIGVFDEQFFVYYEDVDYGLRARRAGYTAVVVPAARVWHAGSKSTQHRPAMKEFYLARNYTRLFHKQLPSLHFLVFCLLQLPTDLHRVAALLRRGQLRNALAYLGGKVSGLGVAPLW